MDISITNGSDCGLQGRRARIHLTGVFAVIYDCPRRSHLTDGLDGPTRNTPRRSRPRGRRAGGVHPR